MSLYGKIPETSGSDAELRAVIEQKIKIQELLEALGSDLTDFTCASVCH